MRRVRILVTGGAGFIGSHLTRRLVGLGHDVVVVDDLSTGNAANMADFSNAIRFINGDLADGSTAEAAVRGVEIVFHQAAIPSVPRSTADPVRTHRANVDATLQLFEASRRAGVRRVVYAASSSVYGNSPTLPKTETMPAQPLSLYAVQKHVGELYGGLYSELFGLSVLPLRYFNVFGPSQDPHSEYAAVIPKFISMMLRGERPTIFGDGETSRDFTFVDNVVDANLLAMAAPSIASGRPVNIGAGKQVTLNELVVQLNYILGTNLEPQYLPARTGDVRHSLADISIAEQLLGYRPKVTFEDGLAMTAASLQAAEAGTAGSTVRKTEG